MGNQIGKCFTGGDHRARRRNDHDHPPHDDGLGHSFCYMRHDSSSSSSATAAAAYPPFRAISGASISANVSTPPSTDTFANSNSIDKASAFESSNFFSSIPLQPIPRNSIPAFKSGPILRNPTAALGPIERGFLSGPIERSFLSGPLENHPDQSQRFNSNNNNNYHYGVRKSNKWGFPRNFKMALSKPFWGLSRELRSEHTSTTVSGNSSTITSNILSSAVSLTGESDDLGNESFGSQNVQWAQGKAGEDRVHVVISEEHGWIFVGIYDGFNGPDATDFLLQNLYINVYKELKGLLWWEKGDPPPSGNQAMSLDSNERVRLNRILREKLSKLGPDGISGDTVNHLGVLKALSEGLRKTEASYLQITDMMLMENPELALMGSCALVMVMKGDDVYLMNVGDSRVVLAQKAEDDSVLKMKAHFEETLYGYEYDHVHQLSAHQLTIDHSTSIREEVVRIRSEHMDDPYAIVNDRVKGSLKVTRAFGAGYLKNPKWNDALLNVFRIDYIGSSPYISCSPSLCHHKLDPTDKFLILSSDGLYQYFTNDEAVAEVETFMSTFPEGDPAQHLVEEVLFRAAKKAGMDFHELIEIPQGDRRRYHDDVSIIIISFEGRIWRSSV